MLAYIIFSNKSSKNDIICFSSQGSQFTGMCKDFYDNFKIGRRIIEEIEDHTKINLSSIIFKNENNLLDQQTILKFVYFLVLT